MSSHPIDYTRLAYDRGEITDTLYRFAAGLDMADADLLASSLTADAVLDFAPGAAKTGLPAAVLESRDTIVAALIPTVGSLDTSHSISNARVAVHGDKATLQAYVMAQHFMPGEGPRADNTRHALLMNRYSVGLIRDGDQWRMRHVLVDNAWFAGDPSLVGGT